ncbi:MAG: hypothetical protein KF749_17175 [Bacteroidetes bacterium]|nr:hypothetical protein [Bacteroidota bacterium]MCW5895761.1 hypothetical protein [Bacteroidota bacterium]
MRRTLAVAACAALCALALTCKKEPPVVPPNGGPDTTSHNWTFTTDSIGEFGSYLRDVALLDDGTAWAVGALFGVDTTGPFGQQAVGAMMWNGTMWMPTRVITQFTGPPTNVAPIRGVLALASNNIWFAAGSVVHWNGTSYVGYPLRGTILSGNETIEKLWGTSSSLIIGVGNEGTVVRWNGSTWLKLVSNTTVDLLDVWGSPDGSVVWACGYRPDYSESVLLRYDGAAWQTIWKTPPPVSNQPYDGLLQTVWSTGNDSLYVAGAEGVWRQHPAGGTARKEVLPLGSFPTRVRGSAGNDLFIAGFDGMVWHFNGNIWRRFHHLTNSLHVYNGVGLRGNTVIAVGADYSATIQRGLVLVGTRP